MLCLLLGYPLAYAIAFKAGRWRNLMLVLVIAPFFTSFLIRTLAWKTILSDDGFVVERRCSRCTCSAPDGRLLATPLAVVCGLTYNFLPFMMLPLYAAWSGSTRGCSRPPATCTPRRSRRFRKVTLPLSMPGVVAGTLLTFIPAAGDYINAELLGTPNTQMIGNVIQDQFPTSATTRRPRRLSFILMLLDPGHGARSTSAGPGRRSWSDAALQRDRRWLSDHVDHDRRRSLVLRLPVPPIVVVVVLISLQQARRPLNRTSSTRFTIDNWTNPCGPAGMCELAGAQHPDRRCWRRSAPRSSAR